MDEKALGEVVGALQGARRIAESYRDELGCEDLALLCYALGAVEADLLEAMDGLTTPPFRWTSRVISPPYLSSRR